MENPDRYPGSNGQNSEDQWEQLYMNDGNSIARHKLHSDSPIHPDWRYDSGINTDDDSTKVFLPCNIEGLYLGTNENKVISPPQYVFPKEEQTNTYRVKYAEVMLKSAKTLCISQRKKLPEIPQDIN